MCPVVSIYLELGFTFLQPVKRNEEISDKEISIDSSNSRNLYRRRPRQSNPHQYKFIYKIEVLIKHCVCTFRG